MRLTSEESVSQKKIRKIAFIFIICILMLTFFSNTITNYNLPEVYVEKVQAQSLVEVLRIEGTVMPSDPYEITVKESRKIKTVNVKEDEFVRKGDVIYTLEDSESPEAESIKNEIDEISGEYNLALIENAFSSKEKEVIESLSVNDIDGMLKEINTLKSNYTSSEADVEKLKAELDSLSNEMQNEVLTEDEKKVYELTSEINALEYEKIGINNKLEKAEEELNDEREKYEENKDDNEQKKENNGQNNGALEDKKNNVNNVKNEDYEITQKIDALKYELSQLELSIDYQKKIEAEDENSLIRRHYAKNMEVEDAIKKTEINLEKYNEKKEKYSEMLKAQELYKKMLNLKNEYTEILKDCEDGKVISPIDGKIIDILYSSGNTFEAGSVIAIISRNDDSYYIKGVFNVKNEELLKSAEEINLDNIEPDADIKVTIDTISNVQENKHEKEAVFKIDGGVFQVDDSNSITIMGPNRVYDHVLPTVALREDSFGKYVLVVKEKKTLLGEQYYTEKVRISEIEMSTDTKVAVSAFFDENTYVVTYSSEPIDGGERVKLANE